MLLIRETQMDALRNELLERFVDEVLDHVREFFDVRCTELGEDGTRALIRDSIDRALAYGIERKNEVCKFVDISFVFGRGFDQEQPWAQPILRSDSPPEQRLQELFEVAVRRADDV